MRVLRNLYKRLGLFFLKRAKYSDDDYFDLWLKETFGE